MNILALHTSTHAIEESSSAALTRAALTQLKQWVPTSQIRWIDASKLHIVQNLSCYANGMSHCADPKSGPYRCWAHVSSLQEPKKYGGVDQMPVIYDGLDWADVVLFSSSTRWGTRSALCQKIIERMNTLENRAVAYGERYPMAGKKLGVVMTGVDWRTEHAARDLVDALRWWSFLTSEDYSCALWWQRSMDPYFEQPDNNKPYLERWTLTEQGKLAVEHFARSVFVAQKRWV
jgi:multimeric flavodoxin WrbA